MVEIGAKTFITVVFSKKDEGVIDFLYTYKSALETRGYWMITDKTRGDLHQSMVKLKVQGLGSRCTFIAENPTHP
mgnify:CR=1 FL=1